MNGIDVPSNVKAGTTLAKPLRDWRLDERVDVIVEPLVIKNGAFELPTKPGLGVELNKEVFDRYVYKPRDLDHFKEEREIVL